MLFKLGGGRGEKLRELFVGLFLLFLCIGGQEFVSLGEFNSKNEADLSGENVNSWRSRFILSKIVPKRRQRRQPYLPKFDVSFSLAESNNWIVLRKVPDNRRLVITINKGWRLVPLIKEIFNEKFRWLFDLTVLLTLTLFFFFFFFFFFLLLLLLFFFFFLISLRFSRLRIDRARPSKSRIEFYIPVSTISTRNT